MPDTYALGQQLVDLCQQGKHLDAINTLYAEDIVSVEAMAAPDGSMPAQMQGLDAIRGKNRWWIDNHEVHSGTCTGPFPHGNRFIVFFNYDITPKSGPMQGQRMQMEEAGLYTVKGGKIVREEFFYHMG